MLLVSFEPKGSRHSSGGTRTVVSAAKARKPKRAKLEEELDHLRQELRISVGDLQAANEELASANEEAQSANEELQSTNEELQTSKEETQSLNEELQTVNAELTDKLRGLEQSNDDLLNLMSNIEIATIFLDDRLRVKRFTPQARSVARLIDTDLGRPLADLATPLDYPDLLSDAGSVLASLRPMEKQASAPGGIWYTVRIRPYRTRRNAVEGLVVTFIDITDTKQRERIETARVLAEGIVDAVHEPLLVLDPQLCVVRANRSYDNAFREDSEPAEGRSIGALNAGLWSDPQLEALLTATLRSGIPFEGTELVREVPGIGRRKFVLSGRPVSVQGENEQALIVLGIHDAGAEEGGA
jgi:two-component system CheB/CheR fusion protein